VSNASASYEGRERRREKEMVEQKNKVKETMETKRQRTK
jgi:hypothetical protein